MIFTRTFIVAALFATVLAALMTQPAISFANSDQNNVGCSSASTKAYAVTRDGVLRTKDCDKNKTTSSKSWIQDYVISDIGDIETSKFVTTNLEGELKKKYLVVTKEVKNYVLKHKKLDLNKRVKSLLEKAIKACRDAGKYVGICGQGPSDHLDLAELVLA